MFRANDGISNAEKANWLFDYYPGVFTPRNQGGKMNKTIWKYLIIALMIPALMVTVACSKKAVKMDTGTPSITNDAAEREAKRLAEEKRLREEALEAQKRAALAAAEQARSQFVNNDVYFDFDSAVLTKEAQALLNQKRQWLLMNSDGQVTVEGHCDERGTNAYNLALGDRRAQSAKKFLVKSGISESRLSTVSYGEERPVDTGNTEAAWARNRRAHFTLK
jgi:peptidoglycan-associated lipoprotein